MLDFYFLKIVKRKEYLRIKKWTMERWKQWKRGFPHPAEHSSPLPRPTSLAAHQDERTPPFLKHIQNLRPSIYELWMENNGAWCCFDPLQQCHPDIEAPLVNGPSIDRWECNPGQGNGSKTATGIAPRTTATVFCFAFTPSVSTPLRKAFPFPPEHKQAGLLFDWLAVFFSATLPMDLNRREGGQRETESI